MHFLWSLIVTVLAHRLGGATSPAKRFYDKYDYYVLEHTPSAATLEEVAQSLGVEVVEQAGELRDHWLVRTAKLDRGLSARGLLKDSVLDTFNDLRVKANAPLTARSAETLHARNIVSSVPYLSRQVLRQRVKRAPPSVRPPQSSSNVAEQIDIQDPMFPQQWHLVNDEYPEHMMNVAPVWALGFTGKGIISSLVDDGLDYEHEDLAVNFDAADSYDFNDHVDLPTPKNYDDHHGTRCAGQVAAAKNTVCGMGIAYESKVAGVRILSGPISDVDEAAALNFGFHNVSIYSCSWGPPDDGKSMEAPDYLIKKAVVNGINNGRNGKGSVFVFASGNGAAYQDQCNFDGYTNSIYSVTVSAIDYKGLHPYYSEPCAANMIVAYSSGSGHHIVTTDKADKGNNACATTHGGTSAAAPNAVGVFALALEARPDLSWRDIQHLCVETARKVNPDDPDWDTMASGKSYSYKYGFGALDAYAYVIAAQNWKLVKPQAWFFTKTIQLENGTMDAGENYSGGQFIGPNGIESIMTVTEDMLRENNFESLEHINVKVWINHTKRGDVEVEIVSPKGIKSILASMRRSDFAQTGYPGWTFMSVKHWGENPIGDWKLRVSNQDAPIHNGTFLGWNMVFWGSSVDPSLATKFEVPLVENVLPPKDQPMRPVVPSATTTKQHAKPTAHLPGDHGSAEGENTSPAFSSIKSDITIPTAAPTTTPITSSPGEGWFSNIANLVQNQKWVFAAVGLVALFGIGSGVFLWRRRALQKKAAVYSALAGGDEVSMSAIRAGRVTSRGTGPRTTRELYDAFGEVSDDDDDINEETSLRHPHGRPIEAVGFHSGFLDDDEPSTAVAESTPKYRDEPREEPSGSHSPDTRPASPDGSGGSWEHASRDP